jgi:predicted nuclease of restriction endonuclease-like RecB superfamily
MLTGNLLRVRFVRDRIVPQYLDANDVAWREAAERFLELFRGSEGKTRGELQEELREVIGDDPGQLIHQGLVKLLEDRCEFATASDLPPEQLRAAVFQSAAARRKATSSGDDPRAAVVGLDRAAVMAEAATALGTTVKSVESGLFADLKSEQRLTRFKDITAERLVQRYNVALAQAVLLRSTGLEVVVRGEPPQRYRQLLRTAKFHRLVCEAERAGPDAIRLRLDGPLSLFTATQKYGLQLALFLPAVLPCRDFELRADLRWGPQRRSKTFLLTPSDGLVAHTADRGMYIPPEMKMFAELFRKRVADWELVEESELRPLGDAFWAPDFHLVHTETQKVVLLEVLGFWRRSSAEAHLERLRRHVQEPFLLAVSDNLHIDEADLEGLPAGVHRFRNMPLPEEIARLALALVIEPGKDR